MIWLNVLLLILFKLWAWLVSDDSRRSWWEIRCAKHVVEALYLNEEKSRFSVVPLWMACSREECKIYSLSFATGITITWHFSRLALLHQADLVSLYAGVINVDEIINITENAWQNYLWMVRNISVLNANVFTMSWFSTTQTLSTGIVIFALICREADFPTGVSSDEACLVFRWKFYNLMLLTQLRLWQSSKSKVNDSDSIWGKWLISKDIFSSHAITLFPNRSTR